MTEYTEAHYKADQVSIACFDKAPTNCKIVKEIRRNIRKRADKYENSR